MVNSGATSPPWKPAARQTAVRQSLASQSQAYRLPPARAAAGSPSLRPL